jgi:hypothetical protein
MTPYGSSRFAIERFTRLGEADLGDEGVFGRGWRARGTQREDWLVTRAERRS